ncbi:MAG: hypothetical protein WDN46_09500 [Methylocella sp.]
MSAALAFESNQRVFAQTDRPPSVGGFLNAILIIGGLQLLITALALGPIVEHTLTLAGSIFWSRLPILRRLNAQADGKKKNNVSAGRNLYGAFTAAASLTDRTLTRLGAMMRPNSNIWRVPC